MRRALLTQAPAATILIRIIVGIIFLTEGIQNFLIRRSWAPDASPKSEFRWRKLGAVVGCVKIVCGAMLILGVLTRIAAFLLLIDLA